MTEHLEGCVPCRETGAAFLRTAALLPLALPLRAPSPNLRNRLMAQVYAEAAARQRPVEAGEPGQTPQPVPWYRRIREQVLARRPLALGAGLAMAAILLAALGLGRGGSATPGSRTVAVAVHGTTAMPLAHGVISYNPQTQEAVVTVQGLTRQSSDGTAAAPPIYEVWLIRPNTVAVPAAVLSMSPDGHTWMAAMRMAPHEYQSLATTIEPAGGSSAPTGPEVLQAQLG